jgi:hypothetical protein
MTHTHKARCENLLPGYAPPIRRERGLSRYHVAQMAKQMRLQRAEFEAAINCPLTREDCSRILGQRIPDLSEE